MKPLHTTFVTIGLTLMLGACLHADDPARFSLAYIIKPPPTSGPRPPETVQVYTNTRPVQPTIEVATLTTQVFFENGYAETIVRMRAIAAKMGCDGLVVSR